MLNPGDVVDGKYRVVRQIGEGGMGTVFEAEATRLRRRVAIKVLRPELGGRDELLMRFELEAQAAGRIGSEHIVEVLDLGALDSGEHYMVMEFLDGESLRSRLERGRLSAGELYPLAHQLLEGLSAAHLAGIVHRDLKPDNIFILKKHGGRADFVKLVDFGISKFALQAGETSMSMTRTGTVLGTPYYMSPEQARGSRQIDHRVDLYGVGVILYECLTGSVPFLAESLNELIFRIALETAPPILSLAPDADPRLADLVTKAMAREPAERFQSATEFQQALSHWANSSSAARELPKLRTETLAAQFPADFKGQVFTPRPRQSQNPPTPGSPLTAPSSASWSKSGSLSDPDERLLARRPGRRLAFAGAAIVLLGGAVALGVKLFGGSAAAEGSAAQDPKTAATAARTNAAGGSARGPSDAPVADSPKVLPAPEPISEALPVAPEPEAELEATPEPPARSVRRKPERAANQGSTKVATKPALSVSLPTKETPKTAASATGGWSQTSKGRPIRSSL